MVIISKVMENIKSNQKIANQSQKQDRAREYIKYEFYGDMANANRMFEKEYGDVTVPIVARNLEGGWSKQPKTNIWLHNTDFEKFLSSKYALLPHGKVKDMIQKVIETELSDEKLTLLKTEEAHGGHTKYWKYMTEETFSIDKNDDVRVGFVVRNGIGTGVSLGVDVFTFRLICKNGAIAKGANLGTASIRHQGDINRIIHGCTTIIPKIMVSAKDIIRYLRRSTQIQIGTELANVMYQRLADLGEIYLPSNWQIKTAEEIAKLKKDGKFKGNMDLVKVKQPSSLWEVFNDVTASQRTRLEHKRISFPAVVDQQNRLHQAMFTIINMKGGV
jgi:hypothetical protein